MLPRHIGFRKDVTGLYGGDATRKQSYWRSKEGQEENDGERHGSVDIPSTAYVKVLRDNTICPRNVLPLECIRPADWDSKHSSGKTFSFINNAYGSTQYFRKRGISKTNGKGFCTLILREIRIIRFCFAR